MNSTWDQKRSLRPAPYKHNMTKYLKGIHIGDAAFKNVPTELLHGHGVSGKEDFLLEVDDPDWVDWNQIRRGQELWKKHAYRTITSLSLALLSGFSIARFAEVLVTAGYAQSPRTSFERYNATAEAIMDWWRFDLSKGGKGRASVNKVRTMHEFARRVTKEKLGSLFSTYEEGTPLSQFDMAEVLLGFGALPIFLMRTAMNVEISKEDEVDMVALWRLIGYLLGIEDEFNCCKNVEELHGCRDEFLAMNNTRLRTMRECTKILQASCLEGFGSGTGLGTRFYAGLLTVVDDIGHKRLGVDKDVHVSSQPVSSGMKFVGRATIKLLGFDFFNKALSMLLFKHHDLVKGNIDRSTRRAIYSKLSAHGWFMDKFIWTFIDIAYKWKIFLIFACIIVFGRKTRFLRIIG